MNKIRIIDLLNKIAKGEEVPKKFRYDNNIFVYDKEDKDYVYSNGNVSFFTDYFTDIYHLEDVLMILNDEVEVIEEKEIEKISINIEGDIIYCENGEAHRFNTNKQNRYLANKINELIDVINDMRDKEC